MKVMNDEEMANRPLFRALTYWIESHISDACHGELYYLEVVLVCRLRIVLSGRVQQILWIDTFQLCSEPIAQWCCVYILPVNK